MGHSTRLLLCLLGLSVLSVPAAAQPAQLLKDVRPDGDSSPTLLTDVNGRLFFWAFKGPEYTTSLAYSVWTSDGTPEGTEELPMALMAGPVARVAIQAFRGAALAALDDGGPSRINDLWTSDGTAAGTQVILPGSTNRWGGTGTPVAVNDTAFVPTTDGTGQLCGNQDLTLYRTDGSAAGTTPLMRMQSSVPKPISDLVSAVGMNGVHYSGVTHHTCTRTEGWLDGQLWASDGTAAGTVVVKEWLGAIGGPNPLMAVSGTLFFVEEDTTSGRELWKSDGTAVGTVLVKDIRPGTDGSKPQSLTNVAGTLFFVADDGATGTELWRYDGTGAGPVLVKDIWPGTTGSNPRSLTDVAGTLFFVADDGVAGAELWRSDGTAAGTVLVKDIDPGPVGSVSALAYVGGTLFFVADDGVAGVELRRSDGTAAGTVLVKDINPGVASSSPSGLSEVRGRLFFSADDGIHGPEPWASDGTAVGTALYQDVEPGAAGSGGSGFKVSGSSLYFVAKTSAYGAEVWVAPYPTRSVRSDIDGDGVADILGRTSGGEVRPWIATRTAFDQPGRWSDGFVPWRYEVYGADVDGDGREDLVSRNMDDGSVEAFRSTGSAFAHLAGPESGGAWTWGFDPATYDLSFADVTGDGKADLITRVRTPVNDGSWPVGDVWVFASTGHGFASPSVPWSYGWSHGYDLYFADVNRDGKSDLIGRYSGPTGGLTGDVYVSLSTGSGFASPARWTYGFSAGYDLYFADVDGDGRSDLTARYYGPTAGLSGDVYVMKSTGSGFTWSSGGGRWSYGWGSTYELMLRDTTGDGKADLVGRHAGTGEALVAVSTGSRFAYSGAWATGLDMLFELH